MVGVLFEGLAKELFVACRGADVAGAYVYLDVDRGLTTREYQISCCQR
jgi:hypothetical protein